MDWKALAAELKAHFPAAKVFVEGGAAPPSVCVVFEPDGRTYVLGDENPTWSGCFYPDTAAVENREPSDTFVDSKLSRCQTDPWLVGLNLAAAISRHEADA